MTSLLFTSENNPVEPASPSSPGVSFNSKYPLDGFSSSLRPIQESIHRRPLSAKSSNISMSTEKSSEKPPVNARGRGRSRERYTGYFKPVPLSLSIPILPHSDCQRPFIDISFHSFSFPMEYAVTNPEVETTASATLPPLLSLSQPLFPPSEGLSVMEPSERPSVWHPNSPYVPWDSPVRREIFRPLTPSSRQSNVSVYSRPYSRSGARAPEPLPQSTRIQLRVHTTLQRVKSSFKTLSYAFRRIARIHEPHIDDILPDNQDLSCPQCHDDEPKSAVSADSSSLANWLASRQRDGMESRQGYRHMTLAEYERAGSWIDLSNGDGGCGIPGCGVHSPGYWQTSSPTMEDNASLWSISQRSCRPHEHGASWRPKSPLSSAF